MPMVAVNNYEALGKGRYRVAFDNGVSCVLYRSEAAQLSIEAQCSLTDENYDYLINEIVGKRAKKRAMHILEQMDRTEHQLREKLAKGEYPQECIDSAVEYVKKYRYLDDERFASSYVRYHQEKLSRQQLSVKLSQKGVGRDIIAEALEMEYEADDGEKIRNLLSKRHFDPDNTDRQENNKIYQYILRRGFKSSDILKEMRVFSENCTIC